VAIEGFSNNLLGKPTECACPDTSQITMRIACWRTAVRAAKAWRGQGPRVTGLGGREIMACGLPNGPAEAGHYI
jgi:hypothetical protein